MPDKPEGRRGEHRTRLLPVLSDEPVVGNHLTRRVRIFLAAVAVLILLTNITSYVIGLGFAERTDKRITRLEEDLAERRRVRDAQNAQRDADVARQRRQIARMRELVCLFADRLPRDAAVQRVRREFGCTGNPVGLPAPSAGPGPPRVGGDGSGGVAPPGSRPRPGPTSQRPPPAPPRPPAPSRPPQPPPQPPEPPTPPVPPSPPPQDPPLICLPIVGCLF